METLLPDLDTQIEQRSYDSRDARRRLIIQRLNDPQSTPLTAELIYSQMLKESTRGQDLVTLKAPALATQFVKSLDESKAGPNKDGALFEVIIPSKTEVKTKNHRDHGGRLEFGYSTAAASDAFPAGYGERSATAFSREDNIYQLKGTFPAASLAFSKLRARVEARKGDVQAIESLFAKMWGLTSDEIAALPRFHLAGSEPTRMAAMEDRAYHALACHPAFSGGYRVDMASITSQALGEDIPINWARLRTSMKAIALAQLQGDMCTYEQIMARPDKQDVKFTMSIVRDSQPHYYRSYAWETLLDKMLTVDPLIGYVGTEPIGDVGHSIFLSLAEAGLTEVVRLTQPRIHSNIQRIASIVSKASRSSLERTMEIIELYNQERSLIADEDLEDYHDYEQSELARTFEVPPRKLTRSSIRQGIIRAQLGPSALADMVSHGHGSLRISNAEFRSAGITNTLTISTALNLAVYLTVNSGQQDLQAYSLMRLVRDPGSRGQGPVAARIRNPDLFNTPNVRKLGQSLFGEGFRSRFELLSRNMTVLEDRSDPTIKKEIWAYVCSRCGYYTGCPVDGGWRDLLDHLIEAPEGWILYYWARISIGKLHHNASSGILAPIAAGEDVDFLTLLKRGVKARAKYWTAFYTDKYKAIEGNLAEIRERQKREKETGLDVRDEIPRYIPPSRRRRDDLDTYYDTTALLERSKGYTEEQYRKMVEYQVKSKVFAKIDTHTLDRKLAVGIPDSEIVEMLSEFYQARWYSLHKRIEAHNKSGRTFHLGQWALPEHPWGELNETLPDTVQGMLQFMVDLDIRAWTINPKELWEKIVKSVSELWEDVATEMSRIINYIEEVDFDLSEEQQQALLTRGAPNLLRSLSDVPAIVIPTPGFRILPSMPSIPPQERVNIPEPSQDVVGEQPELDAALEISDDQALPEYDDDDLSDLIDMNLEPTRVQTDGVITELKASTRYLTFREIWSELGLKATDDIQICYALGIDPRTDLSSEHMDSLLGPVLTIEQIDRVARVWAPRLPGIRKRLGHTVEAVHRDDM